MQENSKYLKKNKNKIVEQEQEIFNVIPYDAFIQAFN